MWGEKTNRSACARGGSLIGSCLHKQRGLPPPDSREIHSEYPLRCFVSRRIGSPKGLFNCWTRLASCIYYLCMPQQDTVVSNNDIRNYSGSSTKDKVINVLISRKPKLLFLLMRNIINKIHN